MSWLAALEAWARVTYGVVVFALAKVTALFGLFLNAVFGYVAPLETPETLYYVLLTFVI